MKILCVIDSLGSGGAQKQLVTLAIGFKEEGHDVSFLVYHRLDFFKEVLINNNISIYEVIEPTYLRRLLKMRRHIRSGGYNVVISFLQASNFICEISSLPKRSWKLVVGERSANPNILKSTRLRVYRWFHFLADVVVSNSYSNLQIVKQVNPLLQNHKLRVIYNAIDTDKLEINEAKYTPRINGKLNLVILASHQYLKNLNGLIEAVNMLSQSEKESLIINWYGGTRVDDSKEKARIKIDKLGLQNIFNFHEPIIEIRQIIEEADLVGLFSLYEGMPNVIIEAMAYQKPVIVSKVSDIPTFLNEDINGFLCDANDYKSIYIALQKAIHSDVTILLEMGRQNRIKCEKMFKKEHILHKYLKILHN